MDIENTTTEEVVEAETDLEVAEPDEDPEDGRNYQEVAEPESEEDDDEVQSHEDNAKFQEYRHRMEEAEARAEEIQRELDELKAQQSVREEVYSDYLDDEDIDSVIADALGLSSDQLQAEIERRAYVEKLEAENERFKAEKEEALQREQEARENEALTAQLQEVNKIDPSITNVLDFEEKFAGLSHTPTDYLEKGLTLTETYWALKSEQDMHKRTPPPEVGGVKNEPSEKPYYTKEDVLAMTPEERTKHWKEIRESQHKW